MNAQRTPAASTEKPFAADFYRGQTFEGILFEAGKISDREFVECRFVKCNFERTQFKDVRFENCSFVECNLSLIKQISAGFLGVKFERTKIIGVDWTHPKNPFQVSFDGCNLNHCIFTGVKLHSTRFTGCSIREADFTGADLTKCDFDSTDLARSRFENCNLSHTDFSRALGYAINPNLNKLKKTKFSLPEAASLLSVFDIELK